MLHQNPPKDRQPILILTGLSGAGKSLFLKTLEDLGYETIDNLPLALLEPAVCEGPERTRPLAIHVDLRGRDFSPQALGKIRQRLIEKGQTSELIFLDSSPHVLKLRFEETRRFHPRRTAGTLGAAVEEEITLLAPLKKEADHVIDTSLLTPPELRKRIRREFAFPGGRPFMVDVLSFSFKRGLPAGAHYVFDVRFLKNPFYHIDLKALTGRDDAVQEFFSDDPPFFRFIQNVKELLAPVIAAFEAEGRGDFLIAFGCSGGQHRSVVSATLIADWLRQKGVVVSLGHRELDGG